MRSLRFSILVTAILFNAVLLLGILSLRAIPARSTGKADVPAATVNGDVNCSGEIDLADPVYLLSYLFAHGPDPCAFAATPPCECEELLEEVRAIKATVSSCCPRWPPRPEDMVTLDVDVQMHAGAPQPIYTVPQDRWFVLTDYRNTVGSSLVQILGENIEDKIDMWVGQTGGGTALFHSSLGIAFSPGSQVALRYAGDNSGRVLVSGYLTQVTP